MTMWPPRKEDLKRPVYRSLAQCLSDAIHSGALRAGSQLPTHRSLAYDLGLSVQTVSRAYEELGRLGLIQGEVGRGSYVRTEPTEARIPWHRRQRGDNFIDCSMLAPVLSDNHKQRMADTLVEIAGDLSPSEIFSFRPRATLDAHCERALHWLGRCGVEPRRGQVIPTNGCTAAMTVALMTAAHPGELVLTEEIGHHTLKPLTAALGLRLDGLRIDDEGIVPEAFERACRNEPVKVLFALPSALNPTAAMMGAARRAELADIARRHDVWIVENDAWGPLLSRRPPPIAAFAPDQTLYFTGLTKCVLPGLRIGWLVVPERLIAAAMTRHLVTNWMATPLMAEIATRWIENGTAAELTDWQRAQLVRRNALAAEAFRDIEHRHAPDGMHVWLTLPEAWREDAFVAHARHEGVAVAAGANFATGEAPVPPAVRVSLGDGSEQDIATGLSVIARLAASEPEPALLAY